ncbi:MAG: response regulator [candidate division NC10 bacterium]|nr:response regulator [candidate division NC10 bacterium]
MAQAKILIIDDEKLVRTMLTDLLRARGHTVVTAEDGASGLAAAQKERPNVIILDVMMPGIDGFEVCEALKKDAMTARIPVIILTASDDPHLTKKAFKVGAAFTLIKTSKPERVLSTLHLALTLAPPA